MKKYIKNILLPYSISFFKENFTGTKNVKNEIKR